MMWGQWNWFGIRMNIISSIIMLTGVTTCILARSSENKVMLALVLSYVLEFNGKVLHGVYNVSNLEKCMI